MPPQVNAVITAVGSAGSSASAGGAGDDWDRPAPGGAAGDPDAKFAGEVRAYYREKTERLQDGNVHTRRTLIIDTVDLEALELDTDDVITFTPEDGAPAKGVAQAIVKAKLAGVPSTVATTRIELDPA